jgi:hypothetical protein
MSIIIPSVAQKTWDDLYQQALTTDEYSYLVYDFKEIASDPNKKVQMFIKTYVPPAKRSTATANVRAAMENLGYTVEQKNSSNPELDIVIPDNTGGKKIQVIRVQFKPSNAAGSGGGAAATKIQESAFCLYCALRWHVIKKDLTLDNIFSTKDIEAAKAYIDTPGVTTDQIMEFDPDWKEIFMDGANKLHNKIKDGDYEFLRGDTSIDDGVIKEAFSNCKATTKPFLSQEDKWNPADMWIVNKSDKNNVIATLKPFGKKGKNSGGSIEALNLVIETLFTEKKLMGVSLKKTGGSASVKIMNETPPAQRRAELQVEYKKTKTLSEITYDSGRNMTKDPEQKYPMDVYLYYGNGSQDRIQLRNFGGDSKGDWKMELKGTYAAMGKIQGQVARDLLKAVGFNNVPEEPSWPTSKPGPGNAQYNMTKEIYKLLLNFNAKGLPDKDQAQGTIAEKRQSWRYSKLSGLRFLEWLDGLDDSSADKVLREIYLYAGSQQDHSSVYYKYS